ncbi:hypothetical protein ACFXAW_07250 [Streptomyces sp. NPDC059445]|uniref:hypothetical protein n=1 Tax=Streptomyces sp. NPDC059445 TaxID=3346832 RepID=UPI0036752D9A
MTMVPDQPNELILTESRTMRAQTADRVDVLDKVKALALLPDDAHATTDIVANYFEVDIEAIKSLVKDNRVELFENGMRILVGEELRSFKALCGIESKARSLATYSRRTILNVGQLLRDSSIARQVRTYLLDAESEATHQFMVPTTFAGALELAARQARELEDIRAENTELVETNARLSPEARVADDYEANPGITPTVFHKTHFPEVGERDFFEHLYRKDYLIDQRNTRWDERRPSGRTARSTPIRRRRASATSTWRRSLTGIGCAASRPS